MIGGQFHDERGGLPGKCLAFLEQDAGMVAVFFAPLGFGTWQAAVATITGLIAKEEVVSTMQVLYPGDLTANIAMTFTAASAYSFMVFNLLCALIHYFVPQP